MAVLLVSHDFGVIAQVCDRVAVMYGGYIVETGAGRNASIAGPEHPYTRGLLESIPRDRIGRPLDSAAVDPRHAAGPDRATTGLRV